jgi:hypothetical protein
MKTLEKKIPEFFIGFEFEGYVKWDREDDFMDELYALDPAISVGEDGSIEPPNDYNPHEIRTDALPLKKGLILLNKILAFFEEKQSEKIWGTNKSCGMHINISEKNIFNDQTASEKFYCRMLQKFHQKRILKMFDRSKNTYCHAIPIKKSWKENFDKLYFDFKSDNGDNSANESDIYMQDKYLAMAYRDGERIEFRCLGNKNYELKKDKIDKTIQHIYDCALRSYVECIEDKNLLKAAKEKFNLETQEYEYSY